MNAKGARAKKPHFVQKTKTLVHGPGEEARAKRETDRAKKANLEFSQRHFANDRCFGKRGRKRREPAQAKKETHGTDASPGRTRRCTERERGGKACHTEVGAGKDR